MRDKSTVMVLVPEYACGGGAQSTRVLGAQVKAPGTPSLLQMLGPNQTKCVCGNKVSVTNVLKGEWVLCTVPSDLFQV
jgi:hypothetical protein